MNTVDFFQLAYSSPSAAFSPIHHNGIMLSLHDVWHEIVYRFPDYFFIGEAEHFFNIMRSCSYNPHNFGINMRLNGTRAFMIYKFLELLDTKKIIYSVTVVYFFDICLDVFSIAQKTDFGEIEQHEEVELLAFFEPYFFLFVDLHDSFD